MSFQATAWAVNQRTKNVNTQCLLLVLASYADELGVSWPSIKRLSEETRLSRSAVIRNLEILVDAGYLVRLNRRSDGRQDTNLYELQLQKAGCISDTLQQKAGCQSQEKLGVTGDTLIVNTVSSEPNGSSEPVNSQEQAPPNPPRTKPTPIDPKWQPPPEAWVKAKKMLLAVDVAHETLQFVDKALDQGWLSKDWTAKWRTWMRNANKWAKEKMNPTQRLIVDLKETIARGYSPDPEQMRQAEAMGVLNEVIG